MWKWYIYYHHAWKWIRKIKIHEQFTVHMHANKIVFTVAEKSSLLPINKKERTIKRREWFYGAIQYTHRKIDDIRSFGNIHF